MPDVIFKYSIAVDFYPYTATGSLPPRAKIISAGLDPNGLLCIWAMSAKDTEPTKPTRFYVAGTGRDLPSQVSTWDFIATVRDGQFMWHIFAEPSL